MINKGLLLSFLLLQSYNSCMITDEHNKIINKITLHRQPITTKKDTDGKAFAFLIPDEKLFLKSEKDEFIILNLKVKVTFSGQKLEFELKFYEADWVNNEKLFKKDKGRQIVRKLDYSQTSWLVHLLTSIKYDVKERAFRDDGTTNFANLKKIVIDLEDTNLKTIKINQTNVIPYLNKLSQKEINSIINQLENNLLVLLPSYLSNLKQFRKTLSNLLHREDATELELQALLKEYKFLLPIILPNISLSSNIHFETKVSETTLPSGNRGDITLDEGDIQLIELKKTQRIFSNSETRNNILWPTKDLSSAVQQVETYLKNLQRNSQKAEQPIYDFPTKAILIIGDAKKELIGKNKDEEKIWKNSFQIYRNSLKNTTVITWDELLDRIEAIIKKIT